MILSPQMVLVCSKSITVWNGAIVHRRVFLGEIRVRLQGSLVLMIRRLSVHNHVTRQWDWLRGEELMIDAEIVG